MKRSNIVCIVLVLMMTLSCCGIRSHGEPPREIYFQSAETVREYIASAALSDNQFAAFQQEKLKGSSPSTKEDTQKFIKLWDAMNFPVYTQKSNEKVFYLSYRPDQESVDIKYRIDGIQYRFVYQKSEKSEDQKLRKPVAVYTIDGTDVPLYQGDNRLYGEIYTGGYCITVIVQTYVEGKKLNLDELALSGFSWSKDWVLAG